MINVIACALGALLAILPSVCGAATVEYVLPFIDEAPEIDGNLGEAAWEAAPEPPAMTETGLAGEEAKNPTEVRMLAGAEALYLGLAMTSAPGRVPQAQSRERDGKTFMDASVEVFLSTEPEGELWYRLCVNAAGAIADSISAPKLTAEQRRAWDPEWAQAVEAREGGWTAEMSIPYAAFQVEDTNRVASATRL